MRVFMAVMVLGVVSIAFAAESLKPPVASQELITFLDGAKAVASEKIDGVEKKNLIHGYITPYYASRKSGAPAGILVSFTIRDSHRKEKLGEMEDRIILIFRDEKETTPEVKKISIWLNQGIIGATR